MATVKDVYVRIKQGMDAYAIMEELHIKPCLFNRILGSRKLTAMMECQAMLGQKLATLGARGNSDHAIDTLALVSLDEYARPETRRKAAGAILRYGGENPYRKMSFTTKTEGEFNAEVAENAEDGKREEKNRFTTKSTKNTEKNSKNKEGGDTETQRRDRFEFIPLGASVPLYRFFHCLFF